MRSRLFLCLLLGVLGTAAYANSLWGPFLFDDEPAIVANKTIHRVWPPDWFFASPRHGPVFGRPVINFTLALNYAIGKLDVRGFHGLNITVHLLCSIVLFGIVRRTLLVESLRRRFGSVAPGIAFICALIWMVHPVQTECVNYVSQRTVSVMGLFYLLTLYCAIRGNGSNRRYGWYGASWLACALGMASKEVMVTAPLMVVMYDLAFRDRPIKEVWRKRWGLYAGLAGTWLILAALLWQFPKSRTEMGFSTGFGPWDYAKNQCPMVLHYLKLVFWPNPLVADYGYAQPVSFAEVLPESAVLVTLLIATAVAFVFRPEAGFLAAWVFLILAPNSSFIPVPTEVGAERRIYLPLAGPIVLLVTVGYVLLRAVAQRLRKRSQTAHRAFANFSEIWIGGAVVLVVGITLMWTTVLRNQDYRSRLSLWQTVVNAAPNNPRGHSNLAAVLSQKDPDAALEQYLQAIAIDPDFADAHLNLGLLFMSMGDLVKGVDRIRRAVEISPNDAQGHFYLGEALSVRGDLDGAINYYKQAIRIVPDHAPAHCHLGVALMSQGNPATAIKHYLEAIAVLPDYLDAHYNLGVAMASQGDVDRAMHHYFRAIQIKPDFAFAHVKLGNLLRSQGKVDQAIGHYRRALRITPDSAKAHYNLGVALRMAGRLDGALEQFQRALRRNPKWLPPLNAAAWILATHPDGHFRNAGEAIRLAERAADLTKHQNGKALDTLAAAYASAGQFDRAVTTAQAGIEAATAAGAEKLAARIRERLALYEQRKPYVQVQPARVTDE